MNLYQAIKNFILAAIICRKYNLAYKPFCTFNDSEYNYIYRHIKLNPFHPEFSSILFHEVGHHVHDKMVDYNTFFKIKLFWCMRLILTANFLLTKMKDFHHGLISWIILIVFQRTP